MKRTVKVMGLAVMFISMALGTQAQFRQSVFFNVNAPISDFASKVNTGENRNYCVPGQNVPLGYTEMGKNASIGFGLGYRASYRFDVGYGMVAPYVQADFFWNTISSSLSKEYSNARSDNKPTYFNVPLMLGASYLYDQLWNDITPYAEFGIGLDAMFITSEGACHWTDELTGITVNSMKYSYKPSFAVAFSLGIGAYFGRHVSAGIYYYGLGNHSIDYTQKTVNQLGDISRNYYLANPATRNIGSFALRLGFHF